ncbi:hypothetical protein PR048_033173 [Dryococelus australis]|uniref:Gustatory receptor n=1 Tax=Dryococelus australis TaxID=614101 RepID=A0ABQ9G0G7_9NEOP|nr:hypothetical protein PR048_033173 [Dryococelus australis]
MESARPTEFFPYPKKLRILNNMFGLETCTIAIKSDSTRTTVQFKKSVPATVYFILVTAVVAVAWMSFDYHVIYLQFNYDINIIIAAMETNATLFMCFVNLATNPINSRRIENILSSCLEVDHLLQNNPLYQKSFYEFPAFITSLLICICCIFALDVWIYTPMEVMVSFQFTLLIYTMHLINLIVTANCVNWIFQILKRLKILNRKIRQLNTSQIAHAKQESPNTSVANMAQNQQSCIIILDGQLAQVSATWLRDKEEQFHSKHNVVESDIFNLRTAFRKLRKIAVEVNDTFGVSILFLLMCTFVTVIVSIFFAINAKNVINNSKFSGWHLCIHLMWSLLYSGQTIAVVWYSTASSDEVRQTKDIIQDILLEPQLGEGVVQRLCRFMDQISSEDLSFSAAGFFTLKEPLVCSIAVSIVSYLLVLLQMSPVHTAQLHHNSTK